jgi:hypothetical protein
MRQSTTSTDHLWKNKISHFSQLGGIETSVLDNGPGRGVRIAWINTGIGLRYKVVIDRGMDVADASFNQHNLTWLSHGGIKSPEPFSNKGTDWLRTFGGGLLTTCGLSHTGGPESDSFGERGLHGNISNISAEIESIVQPDPDTGKMEMSITGIVRETQVFGPVLEMRRTISGVLGQASLKIHDEIINRGNTASPHMLLYHFNFGWPLVDEGTEIVWRGEWESRDGDVSNPIFNKGNNFKRCPAPMAEHSGGGEEVSFIDIDADPSGQCTCGLFNKRIGIALALCFQKKELPWLMNWQHWGKGEYVTGLEPATHPPLGQAKTRENGTLIMLEPGETRHYHLKIGILEEDEKIKKFLKLYQQ